MNILQYFLFYIIFTVALVQTAVVDQLQQGILFFDDFEDETQSRKKWKSQSQNMIGENQIPNAPEFEIEYVLPKDGSYEDNKIAIVLSQKSTNGNLFTADYFYTQLFDSNLWVFFDYYDSGRTFKDCQLSIGVERLVIDPYVLDGNWISSTQNSALETDGKVIGTMGRWDRFEINLNWLATDIPISISLQDYDDGVNTEQKKCMIDNFYVISSHGIKELMQDPYHYTHPGIQILSVDYQGYTGFEVQKFNFDIQTMDELMGHQNWDSQNFIVLVSDLNSLAEITIFRNSIGGSIGDGYGQIVGNNGGTEQLIKPGVWLFFSNDFIDNINEFVLESGICLFEGPFKTQNLATCVEGCRDFDNLDDALDYCQRIDDCEGVTFAHKFWGGDQSKGYIHGYGYQIKRGQLQKINENRPFIYSWLRKKEFLKVGQFRDKFQLECQDCSYRCKSCEYQKDNCLECSDVSRILEENCGCMDGYFDDGVSIKCQECSYKCKTCEENANHCLSCPSITREGSACGCIRGYEDDGESIDCKQSKCNPYTVEFQNSHCSTCDFAKKTCLSCNIYREKRILDKFGQCVCDIFYEEVDRTCKVENSLEEIMQMSVYVGAVFIIISYTFSGTIFNQPGLFLISMDNLQLVPYLFFVNVDYPALIIKQNYRIIIAEILYIIMYLVGFLMKLLSSSFQREIVIYIYIGTISFLLFSEVINTILDVISSILIRKNQRKIEASKQDFGINLNYIQNTEQNNDQNNIINKQNILTQQTTNNMLLISQGTNKFSFNDGSLNESIENSAEIQNKKFMSQNTELNNIHTINTTQTNNNLLVQQPVQRTLSIVQEKNQLNPLQVQQRKNKLN